MVSDPLPEMSIFQSTLSVRRATRLEHGGMGDD